MAWETRARGGRYYTRSYREGGRVRREYIGSSLGAELVAEMDADRRMCRAADQARWREERARLDALDAMMATMDRQCNELMRVELMRAGYHQHKREWRKKRANKDTSQEQ